MHTNTPGARANILGHSNFSAIQSPLALLNNPANLGYLRDMQFLITSNSAFRFNFIGISEYLPGVGNVGLALSEFEMNYLKSMPDTSVQMHTRLRRGSFGFARQWTGSLFTGASLHYNELESHSFLSLSVGLIYLADGEAVRTHAYPEFTLFNHPLPFRRYGLSLAWHDIPVGDRRLKSFVDASAFYQVSHLGPILSIAVRAGGQDETFQTGFAIPIENKVSFYAGIRDFEMKKLLAGVGFLAAQQSIDIAYDFNNQKIFVDFTLRLGRSPKERALRHKQRSIRYARNGLFEKALAEVNYYLSYQKNDSTTLRLKSWLEEKVRIRHEQILQLLREAQKFENKRWYISATMNYLKILELDPDYKKARRRLKFIRPMVDIYINQLYQRGVQAFEEQRYEQARRAFQAVLAVRKDHDKAREYMQRVENYFAKQSEELFLRGLGYYSQKNYDMAIASFAEALNYNRDNEEAREYLEKARRERDRRVQICDSLMTEAEDMVGQKDYVAAYSLYEKVLEIDPFHQEAQKALRKLKPVLKRYVDGYIREGKTAFRKGSLEQARRAFRNALRIDPSRREARRYLARIEKEGKERIEAKYREGMRYFEARDWARAIDAFEAVLTMDSQHRAARKMLREAYSQSSFEEHLQQAEQKYRAGQYLEAMELFTQLLERDSSNTYIQSRLEDCQRELNKLVEQYFNQGISYYTAERYSDAIREWDKALKLNPNHTQALAYKKKAQQRLDALRRLR
ncbi:MAG: tetratricopeptide repeat protein [candidate division KSB1 bacterium]|nr:tetratricopeptide repeat protein [candidate division KSB1 bacterium]